jgi:putative heme-binding domain-containing protein
MLSIVSACLCMMFSADDTQAKPAEMPYDAGLAARLVAEAKASGDIRRGAEVFRLPQFACLSCHKVDRQGGIIGPELTTVAKTQTPEQIVESVIWPRRQVKEGFAALAVLTSDGKSRTGYKEREDAKALMLRDPTSGTVTRISKADIEERREVGTLMPDGLFAAMSPAQRRDLIRFLLDLGVGHAEHAEMLMTHRHAPATFPYDRTPLDPEQWPSWREHINRDRVYDFYQKEAEFFRRHSTVPTLLPEYPGLDAGKYGHWGNQSEQTWADDRWNRTDVGSVMCGVFHGAGVTVPKGVCVRLGERGEMAACFNPQTLCYEALWHGGFVRFSPVRHGFLDGLLMAGTPLPRPEGKRPEQPFVYHGFYRHDKRVVFSYRVGDVEMLDAPWVEDGHFIRLLAPREQHPLADWTHGGPPQWPQVFETHGTLGAGAPYAVDNVHPPYDNPWRALLFFGDHDFLPDGTAFICTMEGDVWRVQGLDASLAHVRWRRIASGLHQPLGLVVADGQVYVLGRDQITRLHDLNGDGEADFYECFSNAYVTSPAGHDFICGLQRDGAGRFYTATGNKGLIRISADGSKFDVLATGMRNPDGLGLWPDGSITLPCSEGEWTPASMIVQVRPNGVPAYFGYGGPKQGRPPDLPLVYLPRGLDNSSGGQAYIAGDRWGPLTGNMVHFSYGAAAAFLLLREEIQGQPQGAVVPLGGEFRSGIHRGRLNPQDGQLYVSGMGGWGTYSTDDGCFQRLRYTGQPVQLPRAFHVCENGVLLTFTQPLNRTLCERTGSHFAQAWNYRYSSGYGSAEYSSRHPDTPGHDPLAVTSAHVLADGRTLFLEIPDLQPVNQLHLHMHVDDGPAVDLFATVHHMDAPFSDFPGYRAIAKTIASHPILSDLARSAPPPPNPWRKAIRGARPIAMETGGNLTFKTRSFSVRPGEPIRLSFTNPDVVPHNWVLVRPGTLDRVGDLVNRLIAEPDAVVRQYVPRTADVLVYTDIVQPGQSVAVYFRAPLEKGTYPYLCTFPGHWMVMNGQMEVLGK